ncbi:tautomerase family protein [Aquidulcibacter paucihalophilus]|uniref:tautomerase family protein n=1 Tax=Aquidulcibacter paucihalophilus TaxID=1978549 RepID=UPI000A18CA3C|nr:tautomerase family protein [Aquidulcibacter paucihalophilus]
MPLIQISVPAGSLDAATKAKMIELVTDASVTAEGIPAARQFTWVHINEVPDGGWGMGGRALTLDMMKAALAPK